MAVRLTAEAVVTVPGTLMLMVGAMPTSSLTTTWRETVLVFCTPATVACVTTV